MKILLSSDHQYPAFRGNGAGTKPNLMSSGSGQHMRDLMVKGLARSGHEVFYYLPKGIAEPLPEGVTHVTQPVTDIDIYHAEALVEDPLIGMMEQINRPWLATCHIDWSVYGRKKRATPHKNWVFVSKSLADCYEQQRFVWNGVDPEDFVFSAVKDDYLFTICDMDRQYEKGLDIALELSKKLGFKLVVAGGARTAEVIEQTKQLCKKYQAVYVGDVRGRKKAGLFSRAKAVLFPTRLRESFGLVISEALLSGTPVICSNNGACPEIMSPTVGFVCKNEAEYMHAIENIDRISPHDCYRFGLEKHSYTNMVAGYLAEYERQMAIERPVLDWK